MLTLNVLQFTTYILLLDNQISLMTGKISDLTKKIEAASSELANANVGRVIGDLIRVGTRLNLP